MIANTLDRTLVNDLITLKTQYENELMETGAKSVYFREQLTHINAILLGQMLPTPELPLQSAQLESIPTLALSPQAEATNNSREKLEAIPFIGKASGSQRQSLKGTKSKAAKTKPQAAKVSLSRVSLPFLPAYAGMKKLEAIGNVMAGQAGQVLHMDTIIEILFGHLDEEEFKAERLRMKTALLQGVKQKLWKKATNQPSSYVMGNAKAASSKTVAASAKPKSPAKGAKLGRQAKSVAAPKTVAKTSTKPASRQSSTAAKAASSAPKTIGAKIILPMQQDFVGLSKIDAVLKVMEENAGKVVHIEDIIERLFGSLSTSESKAEKGRMKDVMTRGRERGLWSKATAPLSFIIKTSTKSAAPKKQVAGKAKSSKTLARKKTGR